MKVIMDDAGINFSLAFSFLSSSQIEKNQHFKQRWFNHCQCQNEKVLIRP